MNWRDAFGRSDGAVRGPEPRQPSFDRSQLPADVLRLVDDPERPRVLDRGDIGAYIKMIVENCEIGKHRWRDAEPDDSGDYGPDERRRKEWQDGRLRALGYIVGEVAPNGFDFRRPGGYSYEDGVVYGIDTILRAEAMAHEATLKATEVSEDDANVIEHIPTDAGLSLDEIAQLLGMTPRHARTRVSRWTEQGLLRVEEVPSARGGKPKKLYTRLDSEEAIEGDLDGDDDGDQ